MKEGGSIASHLNELNIIFSRLQAQKLQYSFYAGNIHDCSVFPLSRCDSLLPAKREPETPPDRFPDRRRERTAIMNTHSTKHPDKEKPLAVMYASDARNPFS